MNKIIMNSLKIVAIQNCFGQIVSYVMLMENPHCMGGHACNGLTKWLPFVNDHDAVKDTQGASCSGTRVLTYIASPYRAG